MIVLGVAVYIYALAVLVRLLLTWRTPPASGVIGEFVRLLNTGTEGPLTVVRSVVRPVRAGSKSLDLSPVLLLVALALFASLLIR